MPHFNGLPLIIKGQNFENIVMEKDDNDDSPLMDKAIVILQDRWKKILEHWRTTGERPLSPNERLELKSNIHLLQKQLKALLSVKGLLEEMVEYEKELSQLLKHKDEKNTIKAKLDALFSERVTIFDEMREMRIDESFLAAYFERSGDYRDQSPLPLPPGFMSHEEYAAELKFLKASIHFEEIGAKNDLLQSFCDLHASAKVCP